MLTARHHADGGRGAALASRLRRRLIAATVISNLAGAIFVFGFVFALLIANGNEEATHLDAGWGIFGLYLALAFPLGVRWGLRGIDELLGWLSEDRPPDAREREAMLRAPLRGIALPALFWGGAAALFAGHDIFESAHQAIDVGGSIALGGVVTCALNYLLVERELRPATARALAADPPPHPVGPSVATRLRFAWALASGVPLAGVAALAITAITGEAEDSKALAIATLALAAAGFMTGLTATNLMAASLAGPIGSVRDAIFRLRSGDLDASVQVDDGSEVGLLQAGFNEMTAGLRDRARLRDLFGRHVGEEVARAALDGGVRLGGEQRDAAALFVDLAGSTALAASRPPAEVVALLNRFFAVVVETVGELGGWVNKFEGDAALCVFGVPAQQDDWAGSALVAARTLATRLDREVPEIDAGIGVSAGPVVAGNVGAERRFEYTVIGDPVNEAARLCELAKREPGRVLASEALLARAPAEEAAQWQLGRSTTVAGRAEPTRLAAPVAEGVPAQSR